MQLFCPLLCKNSRTNNRILFYYLSMPNLSDKHIFNNTDCFSSKPNLLKQNELNMIDCINTI